MRRYRTCLVALCFAVFGARGAVLADDDDKQTETTATTTTTEHHDDDDVEHFKIYAGPAYVAPLGEDDITFNTTTDAIKNEQHVGWNFGVEGRFGRLIGIELDYINANQEVKFGDTTIGDSSFEPLTATLNFHVIPSEHFDLYLGPSYSYVNWGDVKLNVDGDNITGQSGELKTDSAHGWGVSLGFDIGMGEHFAFYAGLKYINVAMDFTDGGSVAVNPLVGRLGLAARF
jgi:hypothetical protein